MKRITLFLLSIWICSTTSADEGMWMLNNLKESNWAKMRELGFLLSPQQLYDTLQPSLKDAVIQFNGGCTGITVSDKGLIFTNHHCGYGAIQSKSTVENNYLRDGFVANTMEDEIPIPGMFVRYLIKTTDVSAEVLAGVKLETDEKARLEEIRQKISQLEKQYSVDFLSIVAEITPYFAYNAFYLNTYQVLTDIRMVFAPPSSVGKFGGDTDNWMWPRHTCDFSVFRAYINPDNKKGYHKENVPFKPKYVAPVSLKGYKENSFAMTIGYPGRTSRYLSSWGVEQRIKSRNEPLIEVRGIKQDIWNKAMLQSDAIRIKYASKYAGSSNYWKNSIGMNRGLAKMHVVERKQALENEFRKWLDANPGKRTVYGSTLDLLEKAYTSTDETQRILTYLNEAVSGAEIIRYAYSASATDVTSVKNMEEFFEQRVRPSYKDYEAALDEKVLAAMLQVIKKNVPAQELPSIFREIDKKYKGDYARYAAEVFKKSVIPYPDKLKEVFLNPKKAKQLEKDPAVILAKSVREVQNKYRELGADARYDIIKGERMFFAGLEEMKPEINFPSDANFTMRMSYGSIGGYVPYDGAWYNYYTTTKGVFEKYKKDDPEFNVQPELLSMLSDGDFGVYGNDDGTMNTDFLSNNDITGGNSGSPIFDGKGCLIGLAFDGNWEAMSGDIAFETDIQRCIGVDIRYVLYMIDKWGHCDRLMKEIKFE
ncbi:MAG: S46 family peptidase [Dysgonamonadaceae bacterium]|jgi:hypothetical protein|nr:S46 family peptidase [Dysgonamonadaceae bacterium]